MWFDVVFGLIGCVDTAFGRLTVLTLTGGGGGDDGDSSLVLSNSNRTKMMEDVSYMQTF